MRHQLFAIAIMTSSTFCNAAQDFRHGQPDQASRPVAEYLPALNPLPGSVDSALRGSVDRFTADRDSLLRFHSVAKSDLQLRRLSELCTAWLGSLDSIDYESLGVEERIDWHLLKSYINHELGECRRDQELNTRLTPLIPFARPIADLAASRQLHNHLDPKSAADLLDSLSRDILVLRDPDKSPALTAPKIEILRAIEHTTTAREALKSWNDFYAGYNPEFSWWNQKPYDTLIKAIDDYARFLREKVLGVPEGGDMPIVGAPLGREALDRELVHEMIAYTPDELISIGERELAWCEMEWKKVARELGCGDDWRAALEKVKQDHLPPGEQPSLIPEQAYEAVQFIQSRNILTIPPLAIDTWQTAMMSPEAQKVNPFFLGGETIRISFPTDTMDHRTKLDSMRANNVHFCRATVHHELIPGHHLQHFYFERFQPHRTLFDTPFWVEGWALWWEFHLWDLGFAKTPLNRGGMLFWRTHRAARIIFSLNFHLGRWTPEQCIDFLVERVGHDRHTATGEVRRSLNGSYSPLYQAAYMLGGIQFRALYRELVETGRMSELDFHDRILQGNLMPLELVRARLKNEKLSRNFQPAWKFAE